MIPSNGLFSSRWRRALFVAACLALWFLTQALIARRPFPEAGIGDGLHRLLAGPHDFLAGHAGWADALLIASSAGIDLLALFLIGSAVFGPSMRPFLGLLVLFVLRQLCQGLCALPPPQGMIWRYPGFPSLLVTYGTSNDLFFSGHTAIAVYGAMELGRLGRRWAVPAALLALFEMAAVLVLRAHYTMDVFAGAASAVCVDALIRQASVRGPASGGT